MTLPYLSAESRYGEKYTGYAEFFREIALLVDDDPNIILQYTDHPSIRFLLTDRYSTAYERTRYLEALSYGDPGVVLAAPGPSLAGLIIRELGTPEQVDVFYDFLEVQHARTFFALTESTKGSDAGTLQTTITPSAHHSDSYFLTGEKCLFGNGAVGKVGVVFARTHTGPLGVRAILMTPEVLHSNKDCIVRENLAMTGLRGAQIAKMSFNYCLIKTENLLGQQLRPIQYGMMAIIKTFNRLRTGVGALAIGQAQAVLDYFFKVKTNPSTEEKDVYRRLYYQIESSRQLLWNYAQAVDQNPFDSYGASIAKVQAVETAEKVIKTCIALLPPTILLENQWIAKCYRDCFAWEYMEGTKNMQLKNVYQMYKTQVLNR